MDIGIGEANSLLLKVRLACGHPALARDVSLRLAAAAREGAALLAPYEKVRVEQLVAEAGEKGAAHAAYVDQLVAPFKEGSADVSACSICLDEITLPALTRCDFPHLFCLPCLLACMNAANEAKCPACRSQVRKSRIRVLDITPAPDDSQSGATAKGAKLEALVQILSPTDDAHPKSVVFTHFTGMHKIICARLAQEGISFAQIGAGTSQRHRQKALLDFTTDASVRVFVLSMKAAAVGLTLTCASRLIFFDPGLNLAAEQQAIGRVSRFASSDPCK